MEIFSGFGLGVAVGYIVGILAFDIVTFIKRRYERLNH